MEACSCNFAVLLLLKSWEKKCKCNEVFVNVLISQKYTNLDDTLDCLKTALKF